MQHKNKEVNMKDTVISITDTLVGLALVAMILITIMVF